MIQYSKNFLLKLDQQKERTVYVRLIALTQDELPVEEIQGRATGGSINLDGKSAVRRTCSITLVGQDLQIHDYFWAMKNKFKVEIGIENHIDSNYEDIIWFKQGIFYITSFSMSESTNSFTITINGKDKMAKLNGDLGGNLMAETNFGQYDQINADGSITTNKVPIRTIITQAIMQYAQEPVGNIIINDLPDYGFELWDYRGVGQNGENIDLFYFYEINEYDSASLKQCILGNQDNNVYSAYTNKNDPLGDYTLQNIPREFLYYPSTLLPSSQLCYFKRKGEKMSKDNEKRYYIAKVEYGQTAGYHGTDLVYPDELIAKAGDPLTIGLLDKLTTMLGEFEYFYDVDGKFVFQKKKTYIQNLFTPITSNEIRSFTAVSQYGYRFENAEMISAFSNQPQIGNIKNDYSIWGVKKSINGNELPIHARYAIAHKPDEYTCLDHYSLIPLIWVKPMVSSDTIGAIPVINIGNADNDPTGDDLFVQAANAADIEHNSYIKTTYLRPSNDDSYKLYTFANGIYCPINSKSEYNLYKDVKQLYIKNEYKFEEDESVNFEEQNFPNSLGNGAKYYYKDRVSATYTATLNEPSETKVDWRELIYLMAEDYYQHHEHPLYSVMIQNNNPQFSQGKTGYEGFYIDIMGFWRQLYNPKFEEEIAFETLPSIAEENKLEEVYKQVYDQKKVRYLKGIKSYNYKQIQDLIFDSIGRDEEIRFLNSLYKKSWQPPEFEKDAEGNLTEEIKKEGYWYLEPLTFYEEKDSKGNITYIKDDKITQPNEIKFKIPKGSSYEYKTITTNETNIILYQLNFDNNTNYFPSIEVYFENENNAAKDLYNIETTGGYIENYYVINEDFSYHIKSYEEEEQTDGSKKYIANETTSKAVIAQDKKTLFINEGIYKYWNELAIYHPEDLVFWFDFLDTAGELDKFSIHELGNRTKVETGSNGSKISSIFYRDVPMVEFVNYGEKSILERTEAKNIAPDYIRINLNSIEDLFTISSQGASAASRIDEMLYQNATIAESISLTTMPIYYLEPNIRIYVKSPNTKIDGDYIVTGFQIPLGYNGTMSISATKVINLLK